jgi:hypothetical protein
MKSKTVRNQHEASQLYNPEDGGNVFVCNVVDYHRTRLRYMPEDIEANIIGE